MPKALILDVKGLAGSESEDEQNLRELFDKLNTNEESPLRNKLSAAQSSSGKLSRVAFNTSVIRAIKRDTLRRITSREKQYEIISKYLRAYHEALEDKSLLTKKHYFNSTFELFDEVVKKTKKEHGSFRMVTSQNSHAAGPPTLRCFRRGTSPRRKHLRSAHG